MEQITENKNYYAKQVDCKTARDFIRKFHYSHKIVNNSRLHLGIFDKKTGALAGVLSFGYPMNPKATPQKIVKNATCEEMYELNRMAMDDAAPKLSESQALGICIKWIRRFQPEIKWLLSFSDGKEGNVGIIYQATNWDYVGYNVSTSFYDLDGEIKHRVPIYLKYKRNKPDEKRTELQILCDIYENVSMIHCKQFCYIFPLSKDIEVLREKQPYPKKETEPKILRRIIYKENGVQYYPEKKVVEYI